MHPVPPTAATLDPRAALRSTSLKPTPAIPDSIKKANPQPRQTSTAQKKSEEKEAKDAEKAQKKLEKDKEKELKALRNKISRLESQNVKSFYMPLVVVDGLMSHNVNVGCQEKLEKTVHNTTRVIKRARKSAEIPVSAPSPVIIIACVVCVASLF